MPAMILNTGDVWAPTDEQTIKWKSLYQGIDVDAELNAMVGWLDANPKRRKTSRGIATFCNNWLKRAQDKGGSGMTTRKDGRSTRDMSTLDDLTHDFMDSSGYQAHCLAKHGQYYANGERVTK